MPPSVHRHPLFKEIFAGRRQRSRATGLPQIVAIKQPGCGFGVKALESIPKNTDVHIATTVPRTDRLPFTPQPQGTTCGELCSSKRMREEPNASELVTYLACHGIDVNDNDP